MLEQLRTAYRVTPKEQPMSDATSTVVAEGLVKRFGQTTALDGFDLEVRRGSVCGLLGPNGAGKTTAVRILTTLLQPDGGRAEVAGLDVVRQAGKVRQRIGLVGQNAAVDEVLSGRQNLVMFGRLFHLGVANARRRADELLEEFGLDDTGTKPVKQYSGGMRRRLDLAASLILAPEVLFLDEPTTGLDPRGRSEVWASIRALVAGGTTVVLTTQHLDEADQLTNRICVIDSGSVIAEGTPNDLKSRLGGDRVDLVLRRAEDLPAAASLVERAAGATAEMDSDLRRISAPVTDRMAAMGEIFAALGTAGIAVEDLAVRRPTLDEVFMELTGHPAERESAETTRTEAAA
jgi:ABC-2 type transport system ATP-binding protein